MGDEGWLYCLARDSQCICGRNNWAIAFCKKPLANERVREIIGKMREAQSSPLPSPTDKEN